MRAGTLGASVREAYMPMSNLITGCEFQLSLLATGAELRLPSDEVCAHVARQFAAHDAGRGQADRPGCLRELGGDDPSYRN